jgi:hypothetical protein
MVAGERGGMAPGGDQVEPDRGLADGRDRVQAVSGGPAGSRHHTWPASDAVRLQPGRPRNRWREVCGRILVIMKPARATRRFLPTSPFNAPPAAPPAVVFVVQDQVTHDKYGLGRVIDVEDDAAVLIDFGSRQERITTPCSQLTRL